MLIYISYFQGDLEKSLGLPISPQVSDNLPLQSHFLWTVSVDNGWFKSLQCDRENTSLERSQAGFITFVVLPAFKVTY